MALDQALGQATCQATILQPAAPAGEEAAGVGDAGDHADLAADAAATARRFVLAVLVGVGVGVGVDVRNVDDRGRGLLHHHRLGCPHCDRWLS